MPLIDALLLDPHAFNVWIAYRTDGIKGSGTINDPYNGSTQAAFDAAMASLPDGKPVRVHLGPAGHGGKPVQDRRILSHIHRRARRLCLAAKAEHGHRRLWY